MPYTEFDVAVHEACHAVVAHEFRKQVRLVTIIPEGRRLGYTLFPPLDDWSDINEDDGLNRKIRAKVDRRIRRCVAILVAGDVGNHRQSGGNLLLVSGRVPINYFDRIKRLKPPEQGVSRTGVTDASIREASDVHYALQLSLHLPDGMLPEIERAERWARRILDRRWGRVKHLADKLMRIKVAKADSLYSSLRR